MADLFYQKERPVKQMRDHQVKFFADCRQAVKEGHTRIVGCASVGWGKTLLSANMFKSAYERGNVSMFTVPRNALIEPSVEEFEAEGLTDIGIIQQDHPRTNPSAKLQVASIHTAVNRPMDNPPKLVIVDEVHLMTEQFQKIIDSEAWKRVVVIGLSATPWKKGMGRIWTKLVRTKTTAQLIEEGYLVRARYMVGVEEPNTAGMKTHLDEDGNRVISEKDEASAMGDKRIIGDVVKTYLEHGEDRPGFYYCVNLQTARDYRDAFNIAGVPCGYIDGAMSRNARQRELMMYRQGRYRLVMNFGVLTTGIDEDVRVIGIARIIQSESDWVQIIGRGLRNDNPYKRVVGMEPKTDLLVIDHGRNLTRDDGTALAPAEDIYHDHLDMHDPNDKQQKAFDGEKKPGTHKKCKNCGQLIPPREIKCVFCFAAVPKPELAHVPGSFVEFQRREQKPKRSDEQAFYSGLLDFSRRRGWKDSWAAVKYKERFGHYPDGLKVEPMTPRKAVKEFIKESHKKWQQQKRQHEGAGSSADAPRQASGSGQVES
jgi:superfamily II DNA or RNA helicase